MLFRYDFPQRLDLTRFQKQAFHHISNMHEVSFHLVLPDYQITAQINTPDKQTSHLVEISFSEIKKDEFNNIFQLRYIAPLNESRFENISLLQELFEADMQKAFFTSNSVEKTVNILCELINLIFKINDLIAFV